MNNRRVLQPGSYSDFPGEIAEEMEAGLIGIGAHPLMSVIGRGFDTGEKLAGKYSFIALSRQNEWREVHIQYPSKPID